MAYAFHEYYSTKRSRDANQLNKAFYFMLRGEGMAEAQAKILYTAVNRFGPRWTAGGPVQLPQVGPESVAELIKTINQLRDENIRLQQRIDQGNSFNEATACSGPPFNQLSDADRRSRVLFVASDNRCTPTYTKSYVLVIGIGE
jgi:hypothetical protein